METIRVHKDQLPLCPYCEQEVIVKEQLFDGVTWYHITHPTNNPCGILLYGYNKERLIEWYGSMEWYKKRQKKQKDEKSKKIND